MRIAEICANPPEFGGGSERYCYETSKRLAEKGHEIDIITSEFGLEHMPDSNSLKIKRFRCFGKMWKTNPVTYIGNALLKGDYDIVHAHSYIFFTSNQAALFKKIKKYPLFMHLHGGVDVAGGTVSPFRLWFKNRIYDRIIGKFTLDAADRIASVSKKDIEMSVRKFGIPKEKFEWVPNAIDTSLFKTRCKKTDAVIGFVGRLEKWKGILDFIKIAKRINIFDKNVKFLVVGDGSLRSEAERLSKGLPISFCGWVQHEDMPDIYSKMKVLLSPSYCEGVPTTYLEAMACGVPVVSTDIGGVKEIVIDGKTGFCSNNIDELSQFAYNIVSDCKNTRKMPYFSERLIKNEYNLEKVSEKLLKLFERGQK